MAQWEGGLGHVVGMDMGVNGQQLDGVAGAQQLLDAVGVHVSLDEVAAHLDPLRRAALFDRLAQGGTQVWLTGTETAPFGAILNDAAVWRVANGSAARER